MSGRSDPDPRGLIREAYRIEGIGPAECRTIFLDWALGSEATGLEPIRALLARYRPRHPDHPMTAILCEGLEAQPPRGRRGGARGRRPRRRVTQP